jgi:NDP-sugar pyrophosphorylase family protein
MDCSAAALFPSLGDGNELPVFLAGEPAWTLLDKGGENGLASQLESLLADIGGMVPSELPEGVTVEQSAGIVHIAEGANIAPCVRIEGPAYVGPNADIRHGAFLRSHSWICSDAVVGHATEVKHSVLLPKAKAPHFNYVGDSILGSGVNLGAGCKLSNLRNDGRNVLVRGAGPSGSDVDSGLRKFGAILGEDVQIGCNAVCNPGVVLGRGTNVWPNVTVSGAHPASSILHE